jgi:hypothetical protein
MFEVGADNAVVWEFANPYLEDNDRQSSRRLSEALGGRGMRRGRGGRRGPPSGDPEAARRGGRGRRGGGRGGAQPGSIYRATRIPADHPGLGNLDTGPGD